MISLLLGQPNYSEYATTYTWGTTRLGSCGALIDVPVGTVVVPKSSIYVSRNVDFNFLTPVDCHEPAYRISKPVSNCAEHLDFTYTIQVPADPILHSEVGLESCPASVIRN